jgi:hypothetical protein
MAKKPVEEIVDAYAQGVLDGVAAAAGEAEAEPVISPEEAKAAYEPEQTFTLGQWGGIPQWRCTLCPWDTLDGEDAFWEHFAARHATPTPPPVPRAVFVADRFGNEVT